MSTNNAATEPESVVTSARDLVEALAERAAHRADDGISRASTLAGHAAEAVRGSGERTQHATDVAAERLEHASAYMHDASSSTVMHDAARFVRRHPLQTAAAVVGVFVLARLLL